MIENESKVFDTIPVTDHKNPLYLNIRNKKPTNLFPWVTEVTAVTGGVHPVITAGLKAKDVLRRGFGDHCIKL